MAKQCLLCLQLHLLLLLPLIPAAAATSSAPFQPWGKAGIEKDSSKSVFVRNLPFDATYEDVASFFSQAGEVRGLELAEVPGRGCLLRYSVSSQRLHAQF